MYPCVINTHSSLFTYTSYYHYLFTFLFMRALLTFPSYFFFFQAEDGIRDGRVTGVQTCALPIFATNRPLLVFGAGLILFSLANTPMLPLVGGIMTMRSSHWATVLIAACIVVPQIFVAILSPWVGRRSETWGRRPLLILGFAALPIRGVLFALFASPYLLVAVQVLDGISAAVLGVMLPLVVADVTRGTGRYNAALGTVGAAAAVGAAVSTTLAGYVNDRLGSTVAFLSLAGVALLGVGLLLLFMPETRPTER